MATIAIGLILEKIASKDKDFRYMATSDLLNELNKDGFKADGDTELKIVGIVLQQLEDPSGDISGLAVKCLAPLVRKVSEPRVAEVVEGLAAKLMGGKKEQQRDTGSIGLKTVVAEITGPGTAGAVVKILAPHIVEYLAQTDGRPEVKSECLDILNEMAARFGPLMVSDHERLRDGLLPLLSEGRPGLRKRTIQCLASLASSMSAALLDSTIERVIPLLEERSSKPDLKRTYVQAMGSISKSVGARAGKYLARVIPVVEEYCRQAAETDDELREIALHALESFVLRCPHEVAPFLDGILSLNLEYLKYDPNYQDDDEGDEEAMEEDDEDEDEDGSEDEYSDDEDGAWKVRRAAAKGLSALINCRPEMLPALYATACPQLISRFREREESVKVDVYDVFLDLLRATGHASRVSEVQAAACLPSLRAHVPSVIKCVQKELKGKSLKAKIASFSLLKELVAVLPDGLSDHFVTLVPGVVRSLTDRSATSNLRIEALSMLRLAVGSHSPAVVQPAVGELFPPVLASVGDRYYKVTAEALRVVAAMIKVIRPGGGDAFDYRPYVRKMYDTVLTRLNAQDQDQEVKECAITCMGQMLAALGDELSDQLPVCLPMLIDRLRNEVTRLSAVKAFGVVSDSPLGIDLSIAVEPAVAELTTFLRKANRFLRRASLVALESLVRTGRPVAPASIDLLVTETAALVVDADLHVAYLALQLCCSLLKARGAECAGAICERVLPQALALVQSPMLQGNALDMLQTFFSLLVDISHPGADFASLLDRLMAAGQAGSSKQAGYSTAQCVASLTVAAGAANCESTVAALLANLSGKNADLQLLSLLCLGEIGKRQDLGSNADVQGLLMTALEAPSDELKSAASYALGKVAAGNTAKYLPFLLEQITSQPRLQYLLLHSLKEVISARSGGAAITPADASKVLELLFTFSESEEEGVRSVVAECLGRLASAEPASLIPALQQRLASESAFMRGTVVTALKYAISEKPNQPLDPIVAPCLGAFLALLGDEDRHVRRAAVQTLSSAAHHKPGMVMGLLPTLLPMLFDQTVVRQELIRTVDLGPFKHVVDDGLELRKAAYECVDSLLDHCLEGLDLTVFLQFLKSGLNDHYDVKMPCHLILAKVAGHDGAAVLAVLGELLEPVEKTLTAKVKSDAVKQEVDRNEDMLRSALRAVDAVHRIPGAGESQRMTQFLAGVVGSGALAPKYAAVRAESESSSAAEAMDVA